MSATFECGDSASLISYLYDEIEPAERAIVTTHLTVCAACTAELAALGATRAQLSSWAPPGVELGFRVVSEAPRAEVLRPARWWGRPVTVWAQAAAAVALFGVGLTLGVFRGATQQGRPLQQEAVAGSIAAPAAPVVTPGDLSALEQRLRTEMSQMRSLAAAREEALPAPAQGSDAQLMARVRALIDESEQRQRRELALRTAEVVRDIDAQRQFDWTRVQRALGQFEGTAGAELQRQRQDLNNLIRVSQQPR